MSIYAQGQDGESQPLVETAVTSTLPAFPEFPGRNGLNPQPCRDTFCFQNTLERAENGTILPKKSWKGCQNPPPPRHSRERFTQTPKPLLAFQSKWSMERQVLIAFGDPVGSEAWKGPLFYGKVAKVI